MKQTQEFDGKNVDQAIEKACSALSVTKKNLEYDVISNGSSGIFGIVGVKKARIRVVIPEKKESLTQSKSMVGSNDVDGVMSIVDEAFGITTPNEKNKVDKPKAAKPVKKKPQAAKTGEGGNENGRPVKPRAKKADDSVKAADVDDSLDGGKEDAPKETKPKKRKPAPKTGRKKNRTVPAGQEEDATEEITDPDDGFPPSYEGEEPVDVSKEAIDMGVEALQKMIDLITDDAKVVASAEKDKLLLKVEGGKSGVLIGRRGQTLEAMQFLTDKIINRKSEARVRLKVDIEGYMETRTANLKSLAQKMADKAKKTGKPATINQMTAQDRRIVHLALKDDTRVRTQSMGEGYYRRLVIFPKSGFVRKRKNLRK